MRTPRHRVRGLGAAGSGTAHFWLQRVTALANIPLVLGLIAILAALAGSSYETARELLGNPLVAIALLLLVVSASFHMRLGMQAIIEDYVHKPALKTACLVANTLIPATIAVASIYALLRISVGS